MGMTLTQKILAAHAGLPEVKACLLYTSVGVGSIAILFVIGFVLFGISTRTEETKQA